MFFSSANLFLGAHQATWCFSSCCLQACSSAALYESHSLLLGPSFSLAAMFWEGCQGVEGDRLFVSCMGMEACACSQGSFLSLLCVAHGELLSRLLVLITELLCCVWDLSYLRKSPCRTVAGCVELRVWVVKVSADVFYFL